MINSAAAAFPEYHQIIHKFTEISLQEGLESSPVPWNPTIRKCDSDGNGQHLVSHIVPAFYDKYCFLYPQMGGEDQFPNHLQGSQVLECL